MQDKLRQLPIEALFNLKAQVVAACEERRYELFKIGRQATFPTSKRKSGICRIQITGFGPKNISGYEIEEDGTHQPKNRWRVHPSVLTPVFDTVTKAPPVGIGNDRPATAGDF